MYLFWSSLEPLKFRAALIELNFDKIEFSFRSWTSDSELFDHLKFWNKENCSCNFFKKFKRKGQMMVKQIWNKIINCLLVYFWISKCLIQILNFLHLSKFVLV